MSDDTQLNVSDSAEAFLQECSELAEPIGDVTGIVYGGAAAAEMTIAAAPYLATHPGAGPAVGPAILEGADAVRETIDDFVTTNWENSCDLLDEVGSLASDAAQGLHSLGQEVGNTGADIWASEQSIDASSNDDSSDSVVDATAGAAVLDCGAADGDSVAACAE